MQKKYSLIYLDDYLQKTGFARKCLNYSLSADKLCLHISYLDSYIDEQFIFVFRTSRLAYRIFYNGVLITKRTGKLASEYLNNILTAIIAKSDIYNVLTVAELNDIKTNFTYGQRLELFRRSSKK